MIQALYEASQAGVKIDLIVRGICCLRPGIPACRRTSACARSSAAFSSTRGVFYFDNGGEQEVFCASADWMDRNFFRRIELMFPVLDPRLKQRLMADLDTYLADNTQAWDLQAGGQYLPLSVEGEDAVNAQKKLLQQLAESH